MTPVKDQGGCGSCWAFSAVGTLEAVLNVDAGNPDLGLDLSEQYLVTDCHGTGSCAGGNGWSALNYILGEGIPDEDCLPYRDGGPDGCKGFPGCSLICTYRTGGCSDYQCSDRCANWSERLQTLREIIYIPSDKTAIKEALIEHGPLSVWVSTSGQFDPEGIYRCEDNSSCNHLVVLVGWNDTPGYWILKNSWSTGFQDGGYYKVAYDTCAVQTRALAVRTELDDPGVSLVPPGATRQGATGDSVVHPVWLVNHTGATTSFDLSLSGHSWPSLLSQLHTPSMADGESIRFDVHVRVPEGAADGDADSVTVTAVSGDVAAGAAPAAVYQDTSTFTTQARVTPKVEVSPATLDSTQTPGSTTTQALDLRNASASLLTFTIHHALPADAALLLSMDETGPTSLFLDGSGRGNHAVCSGDMCPQAGASSPRGGAAQFDGQNDRVTTLLNLDQSEGSPGATMMAWVYPTRSDTERKYVLSTDDGSNDWSIMHWVGNWYVMTGEFIPNTDLAVDTNQWQHVAAVFDPAMGEVRFYKNGQEGLVHDLYYGVNNNPILLGDNPGYREGPFEGKIDEVQIYERALSAEQIQEIYHDSARAPWLSWDISRGHLQGPATQTIQFTLDASGLPLDTYTAQVAVVSDDPGQSRVDVPVTMVVSLPEIEVTPRHVEGTLVQGASLTRTLTISNTGAPGLTYLLTRQAGVGWIQISPTEGTVPAGGAHEIAVTLDASASDLGEQSARISVQSNDPLTPTLDVPVTMTVRAGLFLPLVLRSGIAAR